MRELYSAQHWQEAAELARGPAGQDAELDYLAGMSLARLQRWEQARAAFTAGSRKCPRDARFRTERAGAEYRLKQFPEARADLHAALRLAPGDAYAANFLATLYLLDGNTEAALKYWNRADQPRLASVTLQPPPHTRPRLLERAVEFSAPQVLQREAWLETDARLANLEVFPRRRLQLEPAAGDAYSAKLILTEAGGWGGSKFAGALALLGGLPYETVYPAWYNIGGRAANFDALVRWDDQKRRVFAEFSFPPFERPAERVRFFFDARNENWNLANTYSGAGSPVTNLNVRRAAAGAEFRVVAGPRWGWSAGTQVIGRRFLNVPAAGPATGPAAAAAAPFFAGSATLDSWIEFRRSLVRIPEHRFIVDASANTHFGRGFAHDLGRFGSIGGGAEARWLLHASGDDDVLLVQARGTQLAGRVPLDQLFQLGVERDNDLWLRGHAGTTDGRKGAAPLGRRYFLLNSEFDKAVYRGALVRVQIGPLLDTGTIADSSGLFGAGKWLVDTGAQSKIRLLGAVTVVLSYGRDLRDGKNVFFATIER